MTKNSKILSFRIPAARYEEWKKRHQSAQEKKAAYNLLKDTLLTKIEEVLNKPKNG